MILISGFPSSGKTHRSQQLVDFFSRKFTSLDPPSPYTIHHISDDSLGLSRSVYATARAEKDARATLESALKRSLNPRAIVIADSLNYIKGFRYQLYCEAKAVRTPHCVVHVGTPAEKCRELHARTLESGPPEAAYAPEVFENLIFRYEEPNGMNRWDAPLFTVPFEDSDPPYEAIWEALIGSEDGKGGKKVVRPNAATVLKPAAEQNYLYELDKTTSEVLSAITAWVVDHPGEGGAEVKIFGAEQGVVLPATAPSLPQLQRLRRQFIGLNRQFPLAKSRILALFVDYLNDAFEK